MTAARNTAVRLTRCPDCGYDISALPARHRCPECGFAYDESMFMLEGWTLPDTRGWVRLVVAYGPVGALLLAFVHFEFGWSWRTIGVVILVGLGALVLLYAQVRRRDDARGRVLRHYLITEEGVARPGRRRTWLWRNYSHVAIMNDGRDVRRLHLYPSWWRLYGPPLVNARIEGGELAAEAIRAEIQRRINAAHKD